MLYYILVMALIKNRSILLPSLFRLRGKPFSLDDYPMFTPMYDLPYTTDTLYKCGRQVGKTLNLSRAEVLDMITQMYLQVLYVAPLRAQAQRYSKIYLHEAFASCAFASMLQDQDISGDLADTQIVKATEHRTLSSGSGIQLTYAKTSPDRARGIYADRIDFDEIQDQIVDNIPIISESLRASKLKTRIFTGTAKTLDNTIEYLWQKSSQAEWVTKCEACNYYNIPNADHGILDMIGPTGLICRKCGKSINPRNGGWVPANPKLHNDFRGFHIPQIIIPAINEDLNSWLGIIKTILNNPKAFIMQEVLGLSCSEGSRIITQEDIDSASNLKSVKVLQKNLKKYTAIVGGLDWGGAEISSFTVHIVIGFRSDGKIDILYAKRYAGFSPDDIFKDIAKTHKFYNCTLLAADYGMGFDKNVLLIKNYGLQVVQVMFTAQNRFLKFSPDRGFPRWIMDKNTVLDLLFLAIRYGKLHFPPQDEFKVFTDDLLSPYEHVKDEGGITTRKYLRNPSQPDDFCMALALGCAIGLKSLGIDMTNIIPKNALGLVKPGEPELDNWDPKELLGNAV